MCTGFISRQIDAYQGTTPTIDGIINPGEWNDAFAVDLSSITGNIYTSTPMPIGVTAPIPVITIFFITAPCRIIIYSIVVDYYLIFAYYYAILKL